ncbi:RNA-dependent RNA polymerase [Bujaru virus]|uniref:RNA-directed RNA polymerase L n=2 Tax=Bujaru virus TaxID=904679 RepID=A0A1S5SHT0_9VIRU|nr:RNA-dependent RNA polymerase [Bujaru virus]API68880.1 RNA-dependent RNA polymerase [Bujaru virus]QLA46868.1 L [Bujaru virus] [Bujaru virus]
MDAIILNQPELRRGFNRRAIENYRDTLMAMELPDFSLEKIPGALKIELSLDSLDPNSTVGSTLRDNPAIIVESDSLTSLIHNVTVGHLASHTDKMFSSVFPIKNDGFDGHTPDMIIQTTAGAYYVIEFTTFRGSEEGAAQAALTKLAKYEIPCMNRSDGETLSLSVISVHRSGVVSNLALSEDDVNELVFRFRLAVAIFYEAMKVCPELNDDDSELSKAEKEVLGTISMISMDWEKTEAAFPYFRKDVHDYFMSTPPDEQYMTEIISTTIEKAQEDLKKSAFINEDLSAEERLVLNRKECDEKITTFKNDLFSRPTRSIFRSKATCQLPGWVTSRGPDGKGLGPIKALNCTGEHPILKIWQRVFTQARFEAIDRMYDDPEMELEYALKGGPDRADERNRYHRVVVDLSPEEIEYAATLGVNGKKHSDNNNVKAARVLSKECFSINHDTKQLEDFLFNNDKTIFSREDSVYSPYEEDYELRLAAQMIHQPSLSLKEGPNEFLRNHNDFIKSPIGSWSQMISLIGAELSASVKQHVKESSFVVKRLLNSGIYLLIKPTTSVSHIFVSLALDKSYFIRDLNRDGVFKSYLDGGDVFVTEFVSYKMSKITNLCKCCPLLECSTAFWTEAFGYTPWESMKLLATERSPGMKEAMSMIKLSLLTLMEDKATTEEIQTLMRYIVMEGFVSSPEIPKPHKMISKLPTVLRSELQIFLINRAFKSMETIASQPFLLNKKGGQVTWSHLFNPLTGNQLKDLQPLISSCYNGYFKNKEEETEPSALSKMYKKIIELEHLCPETDENLGAGDPKNPKMHEFSRSYLKSCIEHAKQLLKRTHGSSFMKMIDSQIMKEISSLTLERLATLKATSCFNESWYTYKEVQDKHYSRDKLLVRMSEFANSGKTLAIHMFEQCMSLVESRKAMHICLFKKMQHGGLREIYVMGAEERIVQVVIETIARCIGEFFPSDTLCNPANKTKIPESHGLRARKHCKGPVWTCATSDDARKWNQGHFVTKFSLMLCSFTHQKWWPMIIRGCSMFTNKYMMMNMRYLEILHNHRDLNVDDEFANQLYSAYHGEEQVPWIDAGKTFLKTKTGMMQGILHFTSSLLHTIHQEYVRSLTFKIMNMKVHPEASYKVVCDMMQGSDDSSMIISFPSTDIDMMARFKVAAAICFRVKKGLGVFLGIYKSEKCTPNTDFVMEYNSEFYFHSQHVRPTIRWIAACCNLPEVETLVARQEEASNLLTSISEGGGSFSLSAQIQQAQCTLHYMLMGMGVTDLFQHYKAAILRWKDPGLGFFFLDNPYCTGLGGFRFNLYKAITRTQLQKLYAYFLRKVRNPGDDRDELESCSVSPGGALIMSSSLKWGSRQKFFKLRARLRIPMNWVELINMMPEILYRAPRTGQEILLRIAEKVHSPGVVSSLSTGNAVAKVMSSSVYFLSASIFEDSGRPEFSIVDASKYSLLQKMAAYEGYHGVSDISEDDLLFLFPNIEELQQLDNIVFDKGPVDLVRRLNIREATQTRVVIFDEHHMMRIAPEKLVSDKWFGTQKSKIGREAFKNEWEKLKTVVRWLDDDPSETLLKSPLDSHIQIKNFFARMENKPRVVRVTGAPVKKRSGASKLAMVIRDNFSKLGHLRGIDDITGFVRSQASEVIKHLLFCVLQGPFNPSAKLKYVTDILYNSPEIDLKEADGKTKTNILGLLQKYINSDKDLIQAIEKVGAGTVGGFTVRQKVSTTADNKVSYHGPGTWRGIMDGCQIQIDIFNKQGLPPHIESVYISDRVSPWDLCQSIRAWAEDMGVKNTTDVSKKHKKWNCKFWMYDFKMFGSDKPYGCPVFTFRERMTDLHFIRSDEVKMKVRGSTVNLFIQHQRADMHILSYTATDYDISPSCLRTNEKFVRDILSLFPQEPSRSWIQCLSLPYDFTAAVLNLADGKIKRDHIDMKRLRDIIKTCTEASLRSRVGTVYSAIPGTSESHQVLDTEQLFDLLIEDYSPDMFEETVRCLEGDIIEDLDNEEFDLTDIDLFGPAHFKEVSDLAMVSHPLMDDFIDHLVRKMGRREIRRVVEQGKCILRHKEYSSRLLRALGLDPTRLVVIDDDTDDSPDVDEDLIG